MMNRADDERIARARCARSNHRGQVLCLGGGGAAKNVRAARLP